MISKTIDAILGQKQEWPGLNYSPLVSLPALAGDKQRRNNWELFLFLKKDVSSEYLVVRQRKSQYSGPINTFIHLSKFNGNLPRPLTIRKDTASTNQKVIYRAISYPSTGDSPFAKRRKERDRTSRDRIRQNRCIWDSAHRETSARKIYSSTYSGSNQRTCDTNSCRNWFITK